jgi:hypothetical protein
MSRCPIDTNYIKRIKKPNITSMRSAQILLTCECNGGIPFFFYMTKRVLHNLSISDDKHPQCRSLCSAFSGKTSNERERQIVNPVTRCKIRSAKLMDLFPLRPQSCCSTTHNLIDRPYGSNPRCRLRGSYFILNAVSTYA